MTIHGYVPRKLPDGYCEHWAGGYCYHPRSKNGECVGFDQCLLLEQDALNEDKPARSADTLNQDMEPPGKEDATEE